LPRRWSVRRLVDLGTGSGALLLAALTEFPGALGVGVDRSAAALKVAAANARSTGLAERALFARGDWSSALAPGVDLVLCNPPYVASGSIRSLEPEVARHDPRAALDGGPDGLQAYRAMLADLPRLLAPGGIAVVELGAGQSGAVRAIAAAAGLAVVEIRQDLGGVPRAMVLRHSEMGGWREGVAGLGCGGLCDGDGAPTGDGGAARRGRIDRCAGVTSPAVPRPARATPGQSAGQQQQT
ncbi:MAG: methyltransferase domain-containing protein, partial [Acetobacteraceae bacterium]